MTLTQNIRIENWSVNGEDNPYVPPEQQRVCLYGEVYGHPAFPDGHVVLTSAIVHVEGRKVITRSGSVYTLGTIHPDYLKWCENTKGVRVPTEDEPIRMHIVGGSDG